jgi:hypothetical protein
MFEPIAEDDKAEMVVSDDWKSKVGMDGACPATRVNGLNKYDHSLSSPSRSNPIDQMGAMLPGISMNDTLPNRMFGGMLVAEMTS